MSKGKWRFCTKQGCRRRHVAITMRCRMRVPWKMLMLLFFTLFMAPGMSFKRQKSRNRPGYVSGGQSAVPDVLPELFVYICPCLIFCHSKKDIPRVSKYSHSLQRQNQCSASDCGFEVPAQAEEWAWSRIDTQTGWEVKHPWILLAAALAADIEGEWQVHGKMWWYWLERAWGDCAEPLEAGRSPGEEEEVLMGVPRQAWTR